MASLLTGVSAFAFNIASKLLQLNLRIGGSKAGLSRRPLIINFKSISMQATSHSTEVQRSSKVSASGRTCKHSQNHPDSLYTLSCRIIASDPSIGPLHCWNFFLVLFYQVVTLSYPRRIPLWPTLGYYPIQGLYSAK